MLENSLHASVDVISREIRFMSVNPGFVEFDGSFQVMLFHIPKLISGVDISSKSAEVVYGFDPDKSEESYRYIMDLYALDGEYCVFRWTIPFTFFAKKRWAFFQVRIRTTSGTTVESQWSTKLKKVYVTPGFTGGQEAYTQAQQDAIAALNSRVTALEASEGGSGSIQLQVDQTPTENSQNLVTSGGVYEAIQNAGGSDITIDANPTPLSDNAVSSGGTYAAIEEMGLVLADALGSKQDELTFDTAPTQGSTNPVTSGGVYTAIQNAGGGSGGASIIVDDALSATSENPVQNKVIYQALQNSGGGSGGSGTWEDVTSSVTLTMQSSFSGIFSSASAYNLKVFYNSALKMARVIFQLSISIVNSSSATDFANSSYTLAVEQSGYPASSVLSGRQAVACATTLDGGRSVPVDVSGYFFNADTNSPHRYIFHVFPSDKNAIVRTYVTAMYPCDGA